MRFLFPDQIAWWYMSSIEASGYRSLKPFIKKFWVNLVVNGNQAFPPGFVARLFETWITADIGEKIPNHKHLESENAYLKKIRSTDGADKLDGIFLLSGADRNLELAQPIIMQIIHRLPAFHNPNIAYSASDLEKSFSSSPNNAGFDANNALDDMYNKVHEQIAVAEFKFYPDDLFEISHPDLFERPIDRFFHQRMARVMKGLAIWTKSVFTIKEESSWIVSKYGEPQTLPLGGYDELTNKGSLSSLVPSELGYIDESMDFDLFDYKFCENQLMYYKRDSGAVFRIRRDIVISVRLSEFFEHERHLGMLFGWSFNFAQKIIETFIKDLVNVRLVFSGFVPSALNEACEFFRHYLKENRLNNRIRITVGKDADKKPLPLRPDAQIWYFAETAPENARLIYTNFPQTNEFAALDYDSQEMELGNMINNLIESMVRHADS